jgi:glycosyltransferase involved in cell wall biosynthesis
LEQTKEVDWRIVVVENGPRDNTAEIIQALADPKFVVIRCEEPGKGAAIKTAARQFESDIFGFIDADLSADPDAIPGMVDQVAAEKADAVIGSRLMQKRTTNRGALRTLSSVLFNLAAKILLDLRVKDSQCGLKVMNARARKILSECTESGWFLDMEFLARLRKEGMIINEIPVPWLEFRYPDRKSQINTLRDGIASIFAMLRIRRNVRATKRG